MFGDNLGRTQARLFVVLAAAAALFIAYRLFRQDWRVLLVSFLALAAVSVSLSLLIYDTSIDGQYYHFEAINSFELGWNPYRNPEPPLTVGGDGARLWVSHYPTADWLFGATIASAGLPLEATKSINLLLLFSAALILVGSFRWLNLSWRRSALLTLIATLNPITTSQLFTRMNDGLMASCLLIFVVSTVLWVALAKHKIFHVAAASMMLALNLKFSAVPYLVVLSSAAVVATFIMNGRQAALAAGLCLLAAGAMGVGILGWSPYGLNFVRFGHPFYPLMGNGAVDIMIGNMPEILRPLSRQGRFLFSLFAGTHSGYGSTPWIKIPLFISFTEIRAAGGCDVRIAGFGPLFSGAVVISTAWVAFLLIARRVPSYVYWLLFTAAAVLLSVLVMPENWWARYVPQFWLVPCIAGAAAMSMRDQRQKIVGWVIAVLMVVNVMIVFGSSIGQTIHRSLLVSEQLALLKHQPAAFNVSAELAQSRVAILRAAGVDARPVAGDGTSLCATPVSIASYGPDRIGGSICLVDAK